MPTTRVLFSCSGIGILNRGIESFFREAFDGLKRTPGLDCHLLKGAGDNSAEETVLWNLPRTGFTANCLGRMTGRTGYVAEQWSTFLPAVRQIRKHRPHVIYYSDNNLGFLLFWFRRQIRVPYRLLFSNGGPCLPPFSRTDFVHQVAPLYQREAMDAGELPEKHFLVPYGIKVSEIPTFSPEVKREIRLRLQLPAERKIVLSVGWIAREHKRMHYLIEEIARLPAPRPFLQLLGAMDEASPEIIALGQRLLGTENFAACSVPYEKVADYYKAADCFVLASLQEGFGRVYLEALMNGLPVIAHRHPVIEYVLGKEGILGDLSRPEGLADLLKTTLPREDDETVRRQRWQSVRDRFSWEVLAQAYAKMFAQAATNSVPRNQSSLSS